MADKIYVEDVDMIKNFISKNKFSMSHVIMYLCKELKEQNKNEFLNITRIENDKFNVTISKI